MNKHDKKLNRIHKHDTNLNRKSMLKKLPESCCEGAENIANKQDIINIRINGLVCCQTTNGAALGRR